MTEHAYIHIPFCIRKCNYCSFISGFNIELKDSYLSALKQEIEENYKGERLKTIYIGGGTPSLLESEDIKDIISNFKYYADSEITLEANPETVTQEKFSGYKKIGINRISLGVQTFDNNLLKLIGRKHSEKDILNAVSIIKNAGVSNISIDLIYGLPSQTIEGFTKDIEKAIELNTNHISTYGLKIEENSFFFNNMPENIPDDEVQSKMYLKLCKILRNNSFHHYEISNFAKEGYNSKHNTAYWLNKEYYGFGLNASGYENNVRYRNTSKMEEYLKNPLIKEEREILNEKDKMENEIFLALRLKEGVNIKELNEKYNIDFLEKYKNIIKKYENTSLTELKNGFYSLSEKGFLLSNEIMSEFL
jgi:oxygen-independent coproporphyrinogen-3 oxidase